MTNSDPISLPLPTFAGGTKAITTTPVVGAPRREYADTFVPGDEPLEDGELRVTVLGSGNPWATRAQASASILVEIGNPERDLLLFDVGTGSLANYASLKLPVNLLDKVFLTHLHADHTADLITLAGSYSKVGRADGPVRVWGPSGTEPRLGTRHFCEGIEAALAWDTEAGRGPINEDSMRIEANEFDWSRTGVVYESNGVVVTSFPVIHALSGSVGYRLDFAGLSFAFSGDTCAGWPLVHANEGGLDLLIHECFPPAEVLAACLGALDRARDHSAQRRPYVTESRGQGVQPGEAARGGPVAHVAFPSGHPYGPRGTAHGLRRSRRTNAGSDGVQRDERSRSSRGRLRWWTNCRRSRGNSAWCSRPPCLRLPSGGPRRASRSSDQPVAARGCTAAMVAHKLANSGGKLKRFVGKADNAGNRANDTARGRQGVVPPRKEVGHTFRSVK